MKKIINLGLLSVALLVTVAANASKKVSITVSPAKQLTISLTEVAQGEVLSISNKDNEVIFTDILEVADSFIKNVDLSSFEQGVYYIALKTKTSTKVTPVIVSPKLSKIIKGNTKTYNTPDISLKSDVVSIKLNNESNNDVTIIVYEQGKSTPLDIINIEDKIDIDQKYSLSSLHKGEYRFVVSQNNHDYSTTILNK